MIVLSRTKTKLPMRVPAPISASSAITQCCPCIESVSPTSHVANGGLYTAKQTPAPSLGLVPQYAQRPGEFGFHGSDPGGQVLEPARKCIPLAAKRCIFIDDSAMGRRELVGRLQIVEVFGNHAFT